MVHDPARSLVPVSRFKAMLVKGTEHQANFYCASWLLNEKPLENEN